MLLLSLSACGERSSEERVMQIADKIHSQSFTIDTHNDSPLYVNDSLRRAKTRMRIDQITFDKMREGGLDASLFAVFLRQRGRDKHSLDSATQLTIKLLERFKNFVEMESGVELAHNSQQLLKNKKEGNISAMLAIENGYAIGDDLSNLELFWNMGVRAITLCHNSNNNICDSSGDPLGPEYNGLSQFGKEVVREMNRLGIIIDLSHASTETLFDVIEESSAPVMASHSAVRALKDHRRNLRDDEIKAIASKGGLIQVAVVPAFLSDKPKNEVSLSDLADHIDYIKNLVGIEHVGLGTDFDGGGGVVDLDGADKMKNLTVELLKRGYSQKEIELFWGGNFIRFLEQQKM
ncbi:MAG: dipeptidase [Bacteroidales bacterium]